MNTIMNMNTTTATTIRHHNSRELALALAGFAFAGFALGSGATAARAQATGTDVSRYSSWTADNVVKTNGKNTHGTASNPTGAVWSYYYQAGVSVSDNGEGGTTRTDITTLTSPTTWSPVNYNGTLFNFNTYGGYSRVQALPERIKTSWDQASTDTPDNPNPPSGLRPSWAIATYTELSAEGGVYDIGGKLSWQLENTASPGNLYIVIAKISASGDVSVLFNTTTGNVGSVGVFTVFDQAAGTLPESLTGIVLAENEQLAFAIRGSTVKFRGVSLVDQDLTLTLRATQQVPEPARAALLLAVFGALVFIVLRRNVSGG
ncbi:MAG: PEP-CTERM sorting domain-containing protein [Opitutaceae bacterium]|jgi:hypothetical protein|nr:PEP-CTERM sorting domain-containing protein [Opitutaceae bacterium]